MSKRDRLRDDLDPVYREWGRKNRRFPGVAECARLVREGNAAGAKLDIVVWELTENAAESLDEMIAAFREDPSAFFAVCVMEALEVAKLPASVPFLAEVLREGNPRFRQYAVRALQEINTRESRIALFSATHSKPTTIDDQ